MFSPLCLNLLIFLSSDEDIRPGLVLNPSRKRQYEIEKKRGLGVKKTKSIKQLQKEQLEKGLSTAISSDNKGFQMLAKMGFKEGEGLGKSKSGRTEPIKIELKNEKLGLGVETQVREKVKATISRKKENLAKTLSDFQRNNKLKQAQRCLHRDIIVAQRACEDLDLKHNVESPIQDFFWTRDTIKGKMNFENEEEEAEFDNEFSLYFTEENLCEIIQYLRQVYLYCIYCAFVAADNEDLETNCPGLYRNDHDDD